MNLNKFFLCYSLFFSIVGISLASDDQFSINQIGRSVPSAAPEEGALQKNIHKVYLDSQFEDKYKKGLSFLKEAVEQLQNNDPDSYNNYKKAGQHLKKAAKHGHKGAQYELALLYILGNYGSSDNGIPNYEKAAYWYYQIAQSGNAQEITKVQVALACLYEDGLVGLKGDGKPNYEAAASWYFKAAKQNDSRAQYRLATLYEKGNIGITEEGSPNYKKAAYWYYEAAKQKEVLAQYQLILLCNLGNVNFLQKDCFKKRLKKQMVAWLSESTEEGNADAGYKLGQLYISGKLRKSGKPDYPEAIYWLKKSAILKDMRAQCLLGQLCQNGHYNLREDGTRNYEEAGALYKASAVQGYSDAQYLLARLYERGCYEPMPHQKNGKFLYRPNYTQAAKWFIEASKQGHLLAQIRLASLFEKGRCGRLLNGERNYEAAGMFYKNASLLNEENIPVAYKKERDDASFKLALLYRDGYYGCLEGNQPNYKEATYWFKKIAEQGDKDAQYELGILYGTGNYGLLEGGKRDYKAAGDWFMRAAKQGLKYAQCALSVLYSLGYYDCLENGEPNHKAADNWRKEALKEWANKTEAGKKWAEETEDRLRSLLKSKHEVESKQGADDPERVAGLIVTLKDAALAFLTGVEDLQR